VSYTNRRRARPVMSERGEAAEARLVALDLADVEFTDSSGLQALPKAEGRGRAA
jgi:anti-anti-sigma regulatory factor